MFGKYKHSVDEKGRLFVPSKLREELGSTFYVTLGLDHCLSVYTEAGWKAIVDKYNALPIVQARKMRFLFANAAKCEHDKQGRTFQNTVKHSGLETDIRAFLAGIRTKINHIIYDLESVITNPPLLSLQTEEDSWTSSSAHSSAMLQR